MLGTLGSLDLRKSISQTVSQSVLAFCRLTVVPNKHRDTSGFKGAKGAPNLPPPLSASSRRGHLAPLECKKKPFWRTPLGELKAGGAYSIPLTPYLAGCPSPRTLPPLSALFGLGLRPFDPDPKYEAWPSQHVGLDPFIHRPRGIGENTWYGMVW